jgi:hypothetical protein
MANRHAATTELAYLSKHRHWTHWPGSFARLVERADSLDLLSATAAPTVRESIVHLSVVFLPFPPHDDGLLCNRQKSEAAMEPNLFHRIVQSFITRRPAKGTSLVDSIEGRPKIAAYGSQRMCRLCGAITACSKPFCLECGALLPAA